MQKVMALFFHSFIREKENRKGEEKEKNRMEIDIVNEQMTIQSTVTKKINSSIKSNFMKSQFLRSISKLILNAI